MLKPVYEVPFTEIADLWKALFRKCKTPEEVRELRRRLCREDLFYLCTIALGRKDMFHPWLYDRCREVQKSPDGHLDLWSREHYKSTTITFALTIQDILNNPEIKVGIFSHTRDIAKAFLRQIMNELERNTQLKSDFDDILWPNPKVQAPKWSENDGIIVKRKSNPKEATVEAWGLVDGMPTGRHFSHRVYDDVVVQKSVSTPEQIRKTTEAWELSNNLGTQYGVERYVGTRYCTVATTKILMADFTHKPISEILPGEEVVGWNQREDGKRFLCRAKVLASGMHPLQPVNTYRFSNGRSVTCTADHQWWRGPHWCGSRKGLKASGREYAPLGLGYHDSRHIYELVVPTELGDSHAAGWLSGFFDGEGTVRRNKHHSSGSISFTQSERNPAVIEKFKEVMKFLGFSYYTSLCHEGSESISRSYHFNLVGGWRECYRFLALTRPSRASKIIEILFSQLKTKRLKLTEIEPSGNQDVYWLETETGNYIADGFCSKNSLFDTYRVMMDRNVVKPRIHPATKGGVDDPRLSVFMPVEVLTEKRKKQGLFTFSAQMLLNPTPDSAQIFARNQLKFWDGMDTENLYMFAMVDPASGKKKHEQRNRQDYTSVWVLGYGPDHNFYVVDIFRDRYALTEKSDLMFEIDYRYGPDLPIFYEEIGLATDTQHIESEMSRRKHRLDLRPIGQTARKDDRIKSLQPKFAAGDFIFPPNILRKNKEGKMLDFVKVFIEEEFECYPTLEHDDMLDCLANVNHPEVVTLLESRPKKEKPEWDAIREAQRKARKSRPLV